MKINSVFSLLLTPGPFRGYMQELIVKAQSDFTVTVGTGMAYFREKDTIYWNSGPLSLDVPNGYSLVTVCLDRKKQETRVRLAPAGWRWTLERIYNWFTRHYIYVPLAEVECRDGNVVGVKDTRQFAEYRKERA